MMPTADRKYRPFPPVALENRQWPDRQIERAPIWLSTDLRDGNQSLYEPMNGDQKRRLFAQLCAIGFKEIEVAFPAASQTDFDFVRDLIEQDRIPADVTISALTQARPELIERTLEALAGSRRAIVHIYAATSPVFRDHVLRVSREALTEMVVDAIRQARAHADAHPETEWVLEFSPETFNATELDFARDLCDAVVGAWGGSPDAPVIINLPATVEMSTPNVYADQIEWMHRHLTRRDSIVLSVHPHNDRGGAVAAAELAMLAGADRIEGCLFGQGERTGNVDLVTLALNLYTQGIDPQLDLSDIDTVARTCVACTDMPIHPRHPYVGELVHTAFSGSHQDAIRKGMAIQPQRDRWQVPYLPIDPADIGRNYEALIRVNGQSGKGGIAYLLETVHGIALPRKVQVEFAGVVQRHMDTSGKAMSADDIWTLFQQTYLNSGQAMALNQSRFYDVPEDNSQAVAIDMTVDGQIVHSTGFGNGPIAALLQAIGEILDQPIRLDWFEEHGMNAGADARAVAYVQLEDREGRTAIGVGIDTNIVQASFQAVFSALNRLPSVRSYMSFPLVENTPQRSSADKIT